MLFVLIPTTLAAAVFGLSMFRLAALSDCKHAIAVAEWIATSRLTERKGTPTDCSRGELPSDPRGDAFRATG